MTIREITQIIPGQPASDGAGVKLTRSIGARPSWRIDPFLMLDEFASDEAADYIGGFPSHPHRGFQTVTYMLDGHMRHEDHLGNRGDLQSGDVQWMIAGRGIIHSEMPQQTEGRMRGFQLWINLPAAEKMQAPAYRDIKAQDIPRRDLPGGGQLKLIAGELVLGDESVSGPIMGLSTEPLMVDLELPAQASFSVPLAPELNGLIYIYEGAIKLGEQRLEAQQVGVLGDGDRLELEASGSGGKVLLLAGRPIGEPVVQYGPFVMNTREEIDQTLRDYAAGQLTSPETAAAARL